MVQNKNEESIKLIIVAGARPNFMKIASIIHAINKVKTKIDYVLVHTGQHYDKLLSDNFFEDLRIPVPQYNLKIGSGSHAVQTADIMKSFEQVVIKEQPDLVLVVGDVNSTMACTLTAKKMDVKVAHVEAGIRSFDLTMPEEINRLVTDSIADYFFTTTEVANKNLYSQGVKSEQCFLVGNTMIDTLIENLPRLIQPKEISNHLEDDYVVLTLHRPSNVDEGKELLTNLIELAKVVNGKTIIFPVHPRTKKQLDLDELPNNIVVCSPLRYLEFIHLIKHSWLVITDSGGIQEETSFLKVPCITLRPNTERPETITLGTNTLVSSNDFKQVENIISSIEKGEYKQGSDIPYWDGKTGERIVRHLDDIFSSK